MRITWLFLSVFLATIPVFPNGWLNNESDVVAQVKGALPFGLKIKYAGYFDDVFKGIRHFSMLIIDDSGTTKRLSPNLTSDAQVVLIPFDYDYANMQNSEEIDRFLIAKTPDYKAFLLAPETFNFLWSETRRNLKIALGGSEKQAGRLTPLALGAQTDVSEKWRVIEKRIVSFNYPKINLQNASIDDVIKFIYGIKNKIIDPKNERNLPLLFSTHIYGTPTFDITLQRQNIQMFEILDLACVQSGLHWQISQNTIFIYDNTEQARQHVQLTINRQRREESDYSGQGVTESNKDAEYKR